MRTLVRIPPVVQTLQHIFALSALKNLHFDAKHVYGPSAVENTRFRKRLILVSDLLTSMPETKVSATSYLIFS